MNTKEYIQQIRITYPIPDDALLDRVKITGVKKVSTETTKRNVFRQAVIQELEYDLTESDLPFIRFLMRQEIVCAENWDMAECRSEDFEAVAQMLAYIGQVEDIPLLWEAKHASFDSSFVIDAAYFFTNGFEETINYVKSLQIEDRDEILEYLENSIEDVKNWFENWHKALHKRFTSDEN